MALSQIDKRAQKKEKEFIESFATSDISPFSHSSFYVRHAKDLSYVGIECFHATAFHFIETLKVRGMSRNLFEDVSGYFKNSVQTKRKLIYLNLKMFSSHLWRNQWFYGCSHWCLHLHHNVQHVDLLLLFLKEICRLGLQTQKFHNLPVK